MFYIANFGELLEQHVMHTIQLVRSFRHHATSHEHVVIAQTTREHTVAGHLGQLVLEHSLNVGQLVQFVLASVDGRFGAHNLNRSSEYAYGLVVAVLVVRVQFVRVGQKTHTFVPEYFVNRNFLNKRPKLI